MPRKKENKERHLAYRGLPDNEKLQIMEQYTNMCHELAHLGFNIAPGLYDYEDWFQICNEYLWNAINTYEDNKGAKFITFAYNVIRRRVIYEANRTRNKEYYTSTITMGNYNNKGDSLSTGSSPVKESTVDEVISSFAFKRDRNKHIREEEDTDIEMLIEKILVFMKKTEVFSEREKTIFELRIKPTLVGEAVEYTQYSLADMLNVSQEYVCATEKRIKEGLQIYIGSLGYTLEQGHLMPW